MKINIDFDSLWNSILPTELNNLNKFLSRWGFEVELVDTEDVDPELLDNVGVFCADIQDSVDTFPVFLNKELIKILLEEEGKVDPYEVTYAIRGTLWHEAAHGIIYFLNDFGFEFEDEEGTSEDFAVRKESSDLAIAMQKFQREYGD